MAWYAQSLQFALFTPAKLSGPDAITPWQRIFGFLPQNFQQTPPGASQPQSMAAGIVGGANFNLIATTGRFDLVLSPLIVDANAEAQGFEDVTGALSLLTGYASALMSLEPATRLSIISTVIEPMSTPAEAAERFVAVTGGAPAVKGGRDFAYQVNIQIPAGDKLPMINRLCRWQTQMVQVVMAQLEAGVPVPATMTPERPVLTLTTDINSHPMPGPLDKDSAVALLDRLAEETLGIILGGYDQLVA
jgi:hypothetical protein